ncbi:ankyrin repeat domain-containing protein 33B-like isoform X1 [Xyrauchen texanus]|uniref:ankyrin repeat domain-containing protein 33B-like isoform X1 n=1 Tax=Xyrauchen texanus TaxID=154827 RepID=UPI002241C428|nr:ankyrin repeat domain-containing protein 33B-like isoform X1 [Xyrauchen texanus]
MALLAVYFWSKINIMSQVTTKLEEAITKSPRYRVPLLWRPQRTLIWQMMKSTIIMMMMIDDDDDVYQEFEELDFSKLADTKSILSDDSFYPPDDSLNYEKCPSPESPEPLSFFKACSTNNVIIVKILIRQGVTEDEVREVDKNNRTGLIVACYQGFVDVVIALSQCPYVDVNWQDNEGNTALMTAAQAGHSMITNYMLSYFPGLDTERRNCHGFTAMMKAAMQGRAECVRVLVMTGADIEARDYGRKLTPREWALFTGRYETANLMSRLMEQPCAEQFCDSYHMMWPVLDQLVAQSKEPKSCWRKFSERACNLFTIRIKTNPVDEGVMDYMVRMTTALASPFIATACRTVCPGSPPCVGKRRPAVQDILRKQRLAELKNLGPERLNNYKRLFHNSRVLLVPKKQERRSSLQPQILHNVAMASTVALRRSSLLPLHMMRRSSVRPGLVVPKVMLCKAPPATYIPERLRHRNINDSQHLQIPKWKYKALKEDKKKAEQLDKLRLSVVRKK